MKRSRFKLNDPVVANRYLLNTLIGLLLVFTFSHQVKAQEYYFHFDTLIGTTAIPDLLCDTCEFTITNMEVHNAWGGLSFGPDGHIYALTSPPENKIFELDIATGTSTEIFSGNINAIQMAGFMAVGNGIFYSIPHLTQTSDSLYLWDANVDTMSAICELPYRPYGELWQANGEVCYLSWTGSGPRQIIKLNLESPEDSEPIFSFSPDYVIYGLTATPVGNLLLGVEHSFFYPGKHIVTLNTTDGTVTEVCKLRKPYSHGGWSLTSIYEFTESPLYIELDLDCDDSSGATGSDFNAEPFDCLNIGGVPITDDDIKILIDARITSMTLSITNPLDDQEEILTLSGSASAIDVSGEGTTTLIFQSEGEAKISDFQEALKLVRYDNTMLNPTPGIRNIEIFFETEAGSTCEIATAFVDITALPEIELDLGPDVEICEGSDVTLDPGIDLVNFIWSTGETSPTIQVTNDGSYSLTVSNDHDCPNRDTVEVTVLPEYYVLIEGDSVMCTNEVIQLTILSDAPFAFDIELTIEPGTSEWFYGVTSGYTLSDAPILPTDYYISAIIPGEPACMDLSLAYQTISIQPGFSFSDSISICEGDSVLLGDHWTSVPGNYPVINESAQGCDTLVTYTLSLTPVEKQFVLNTTCDSALAGVTISWLTNPTGCDTMLTNTITWIPPDTTHILQTSCRQVDGGMFISGLTNQYGCDSIILTQVTWIPPADTTFLSGSSCDTSLIGTFPVLLSGQLGCDSIVMHTIMMGAPDTFYINTTSCDPSSLGVFTTHFTNSHQCDSTVITTVSFSERDSIFLFTHTCDPSASGVFITSHINQYGCDSIVTETVSLLPNDELYLQSTTCDPASAGEFVTSWVNQHGCDSIVYETIVLLPQSEVFLHSTSCSSANTGTFITTLTNQYGCDSVITETVTLVSADTTSFISYTCLPEEVSSSETLYSGVGGCDSLVIQTIALYTLPNLSLQSETNYNGFSVRCHDLEDGIVTALTDGISPFTYTWSQGETDATISNLHAGIYSVTVTDGNGCTRDAFISLTAPDPFQIVLEVTTPECNEMSSGSILAHPFGGVSPYTYTIDGSPAQTSPLFSAPGHGEFEITAIDANNCTATQQITLALPTLLEVDLGDDLSILSGESVVMEAWINLPADSIASLSWTGLQNSTCPACPSQIVAPTSTTTYTITVSALNGCIAQDSLTIHILSDAKRGVYIPNIFSPNGDGINDLLTLHFSEQVEEIVSFNLFDRWGNMVFSAASVLPDDPKLNWDGKLDGQPMNAGVFAYQLLLKWKDTTTEVVTGDITLIR